MNCDDYLAMLATLPVEELAYGDARTHAATCRDCDRVTRVVAERERNMMLAFGELYPVAPARPMTAGILEIARRRRIAFFYRMGLVLAAVVAVFAFIAMRRLTPVRAVNADTFPLRCLSADQAIEMLRGSLSAEANISTRPNWAVAIVDVRGPNEDLQRARSLLDRYDNADASKCRVQVDVPVKIIVK